MGLLEFLRRSPWARSRHVPVVHTVALHDEVRWHQPFDWGLLIAHDHDADWQVPHGVGTGGVAATTSCLAVPVRHAQDVRRLDDGDTETPLPRAEVEVVLTTRLLEGLPDYVGQLSCPTGRLQVGDAHEYRLVGVPPGELRAQVWLEPEEHATRVVIALQRAG